MGDDTQSYEQHNLMEPSLAEVQSSLEMDNEERVFNMGSISIMMKDG